MKKIYFIIPLILLSQVIKAQTVSIPDVNFKNALIYFLCADTNGDGNFNSDADTNNDMEIQVSEAEALFGLDVGIFQISSLEGIASFKNIEVLYCDYNKLTSLDISQNTKLKYLECTLNQLTSLDISKNLSLENLYCPSNNLTSLDVSQHPNLKFLECAYNELTTLDVSQNSNLTSLLCFNNKLNSLNLKNGTNNILTTVSAIKNSDLSCIEIDDVDTSINNSNWIKDSTATYNENCGVLGNVAIENEIQVICYPNPVNAILRIKYPSNIEVNAIKIYDTLGNLVMVEKSNLKRLDISKLNQGLYIVAIETDKNSFIKRIIKSN